MNDFAIINSKWFKEHCKPLWKNSRIFYFYNEDNKFCIFIIKNNRNIICYKNISNRIFFQI